MLGDLLGFLALIGPTLRASDHLLINAFLGTAGQLVTINDLTNHSRPQSWDQTISKAGLGSRAACAVAITRLLLVHWMQSAVYLVALHAFWPALDSVQRLFGAVVLAREGAYLLGAAIMAVLRPSGLLISVIASWHASGVEMSPLSGPSSVIMYVLAPEKVVLTVLQVAERQQ